MSDRAMAATTSEGARRGEAVAVLAEFESDTALLEAARRVRDAGFRHWDAFTPYPVHGLDGAMGVRPTFLPWVVLLGGITGALGALLMQWWMNAVDYPFRISGKPLWSIPANIPIIFEITILLSAFGAFFGMLVLNGLPRFYRPQFRSERFRRATCDRFFISIEHKDRHFSPQANREFLESLGASHVEVIEE